MATAASADRAPVLVSSSGQRITGALSSGELLGSRYRVIQLVGKGGFGAVYQANDERFQGRRRVAIKEMSDAHLGAAEREHALANFRQEANLLVQLKHTNLPDVSDFLEEDGKAYLIMEFVEGQTLEKIQQDAHGSLDEALVMGWALQLCDVLDYLHTQPQPVIFRDLKPPNIMLTRANQIKLIDFGIARVFKSTAARDTDTLGSQGYAPLEQYGSGQSDARTDIYALGATLYELLTNTMPLASPMRRINPQQFVNLRQLNSRLSTGTEQVVLKAMAELPAQRYQSAAEMFQAIANLGFTAARNSGGMRTLTGPGALTIPATQTPSLSQLPTAAAETPQQISPTVAASPQQSGPTVAGSPPQSGPIVPGWAPPSGLTIAQNMPANPYAAYPSSANLAQGELPPAYPTYAPGGPPPPPPGPQSRLPRRALLVGGVIAAVAAGTGIYFFSRRSGPTPGPVGNTVTVNFAYSTEKDAWLKAALAAFNKTNPTLSSGKGISIQLNDLASVDSQSQILNGTLKPVAWSPASDLEINRLNYKWQQTHSGQSVISYTGQYEPISLVKSPLVLAVWQQRSKRLLTHYKAINWATLHDALQAGDWSKIGGEANWGLVKFGQTLPTQSNSGLLTITLLAYYHFNNEQRGLTLAQVQDQGYWNYLDVFEGAVNAFGQSSGTYLLNGVINQGGPAQADVIATYENLVLTYQAQAQSAQHQGLQIYYPAVNLLSDHPFAVLQGDWATDEQKQAALKFRDFLLDPAQQRQALIYGFRPANPAVRLNDSLSGNPFNTQKEVFPNRQPDPLLTLAQVPSGDVVDALISGWNQKYPNPATTSG